MTTTLTDVLNSRQQLRLYGRRISDLTPRGHLGLALDPDGPVCFASIRCYAVGPRVVELAQAMVISVYGDGVEPDSSDTAAQKDERVWTACAGDMALRLEMQKASLYNLLHPAALPPT